MTKWLFKINGEDFSDVVHKYGYKTDLIPVFSRCVTTLDQVDHETLIRRRGELTITTNPVTARRAAEFCAALSSMPVSISYHCFQTGSDVIRTMKTSGMPFSYAMGNVGVDWLDQLQITFTER